MRDDTTSFDLAGCLSQQRRAGIGIISKVRLRQRLTMTVQAWTLTSKSLQHSAVAETWTLISPIQQDPAPAAEQLYPRALLRLAMQLGSMF